MPLNDDIRELVESILDSNRALADLLAHCADGLREGAPPYTVAATLETVATNVRDSNARLAERIG